MNDKDEILINKIIQLEQVSNLQQTDFITFLKLDQKAKIPKKYEANNFKTINLLRIAIL
jgi:hypothetical protein